MLNKRIVPILLLASALTMGGCYFHGGTQERVHTPTLGKELTELKSALDEGAISRQEYDRKKNTLISERLK